MVTAIAVLVAVVVAAAITWPCAIGYRKKVVETKLGNAEDRAREIVDEALKTAETKKREAMLEAKEESMRTRNELEKETKERGQSSSAMSVVFWQKRKLLTRRLRQLSVRKQALQHGKSNWRKNVLK